MSTKKIKINNLDSIEHINIDELDGYTPQGIFPVDSYLFITGYDHTKKNDSIVIVMKDNKIIAKSTIYNNAHVGGITYDKKSKLIWITDKAGTISGYNKKDFLKSKNEVQPVYKKENLSYKLENHDGFPVASFLTIYDNYLFVGNYTIKNNAIIKRYEIKKDGTINKDDFISIPSIKCVQGITINKIDDKLYLFISTSFSKYFKSKIHIYEFDNYTLGKRVSTIITPPMQEQISCINNDLLILFEGNSIQYNKHYTDILKLNDIKRIL